MHPDFGYPFQLLTTNLAFQFFITSSIPDEGYSRNVLYTLNQISTFLSNIVESIVK
jgi:hypothetical protein